MSPPRDRHLGRTRVRPFGSSLASLPDSVVLPPLGHERNCHGAGAPARRPIPPADRAAPYPGLARGSGRGMCMRVGIEERRGRGGPRPPPPGGGRGGGGGGGGGGPGGAG